MSKTTLEETLAHFGIRGMRWGVRKQTAAGARAKADRKWTRQAKSLGVQNMVYKASLRQLNAVELTKLNNNPKYKGKTIKRDSDLGRQYMNDAEKTFNRVLNQQSAKLIGPSPSGKLKVKFSQNMNDTFPTATIVPAQVQHADNGGIELKLTWDDQGHIINCELAQPLMQSGIDGLDEMLSHFGVKGMKWGVRRAERRRAASSPDARAAQDAHAKARKAGGTHALTNQELQQLVTRMNLEKQFNQLKPPTKTSRAVKFVGGVLASTGKQAASKVAGDLTAKQIAKVLKP